MSRPDCPNRNELVALLAGILDETAADSVLEHLNDCPQCQETVQALDRETIAPAQWLSPAMAGPYQEEAGLSAALQKAKAVLGSNAVDQGAQEPGSDSAGELSGTELGDYRLLEKLGQGGMGAVYRAVHTRLDRIVAVKVLPLEFQKGHMVARFEREMKAIGRLNHPTVVQAYDAREISGVRFIVMEYVDGLDLLALVNRLGPLPTAEACELVRQAAIGLQYAHENRLVHRDIKPSNLMLTPSGQVKILDLGLARFCQGPSASGEMTGPGQNVGTADYMAPEQILDSRSVDIRADIYSLGCTLYKLLSGQTPYAGLEHRTPFSKMNAHLNAPVSNLAGVPGLPAELEAIIHRMLAKQPGQRFSIPSEIATVLEPFTKGAELCSLIVRARSTPQQPNSEDLAGSTRAGSLAATSAAEAQSWSLRNWHSAEGSRQDLPEPKRTARRGQWMVRIALGVIAVSIALGGAVRMRDRRESTGDKGGMSDEMEAPGLVRCNDRKGGFSDRCYCDVTNAFGGKDRIPLVGDFNGDGWGDIGIYYVLPNGIEARWMVRLNDHKGGFSDRYYCDVTNAFGGKDRVPLVGDFNGDGWDDIGIYYVLPNGIEARWMVRLNDHKGGFRDRYYYDVTNAFGGKGQIPLVGDFNGDGWDDIGIYHVMPNGIEARWIVRLNDRQGGFSSQYYYDVTSTFGGKDQIPLVGDFNGDGWDDIGIYHVMPNGTEARWMVRLNNRQGDFNNRYYYDVTGAFGGRGQIPLVGDFNGDGLDDIGIYHVMPSGTETRWSSRLNTGSQPNASDPKVDRNDTDWVIRSAPDCQQ